MSDGWVRRWVNGVLVDDRLPPAPAGLSGNPTSGTGLLRRARPTQTNVAVAVRTAAAAPVDGDQPAWLASLLSPAQAAAQLGVTSERIRQLVASGRLVAYRTAIGSLIEPASVQRYAARRAGQRHRR